MSTPVYDYYVIEISRRAAGWEGESDESSRIAIVGLSVTECIDKFNKLATVYNETYKPAIPHWPDTETNLTWKGNTGGGYHSVSYFANVKKMEEWV